MSVSKYQTVFRGLAILALSAILAFTGFVPKLAAEDPFLAADIDWKQLEGTELNVAMNKHPYTDAIEPYIPEFEELTGIDVVFDVLPEEAYWEKIRVLLAAGNPTPDIVWAGSLDIANFMNAGWLEPLDPYLDDPKLTDKDWYDFEDFIKGPIEAASLDGHVYALTMQSDAQMMAYRKDLFEAKGLKAPETFEELYEAAKAVHTDEVSGTCIRGLRGFTITFQWTAFLLSNGGRFFDEDGNVVINSPEGVEVTEWYGQVMRETGPEGLFQYGFPEVIAAFQQGKCAISLDVAGVQAQFLLPEKSKVHDMVGFGIHPHGIDKVTTPMYWVWYLGMNPKSEHKGAAWLFLQWATSKEILGRIPGSGTPGRASLWENPAYLDFYGPELSSAIQESLTLVRPELVPYDHPKIFEMFDTIGQELQNIISEEKTAQQGLDDAAAKIEEIISE
ncbi:MAG: sugar ABC transporter substrate-binding protein [Anaerolineae bacterium]